MNVFNKKTVQATSSYQSLASSKEARPGRQEARTLVMTEPPEMIAHLAKARDAEVGRDAIARASGQEVDATSPEDLATTRHFKRKTEPFGTQARTASAPPVAHADLKSTAVAAPPRPRQPPPMPIATHARRPSLSSPPSVPPPSPPPVPPPLPPTLPPTLPASAPGHVSPPAVRGTLERKRDNPRVEPDLSKVRVDSDVIPRSMMSTRMAGPEERPAMVPPPPPPPKEVASPAQTVVEAAERKRTLVVAILGIALVAGMLLWLRPFAAGNAPRPAHSEASANPAATSNPAAISNPADAANPAATSNPADAANPAAPANPAEAASADERPVPSPEAPPLEPALSQGTTPIEAPLPRAARAPSGASAPGTHEAATLLLAGRHADALAAYRAMLAAGSADPGIAAMVVVLEQKVEEMNK